LGYYEGRAAVITGAGSGIGRALACQLAGEGARLVLLDRDGAGLEETARRCSAAGAEVRADVADVTDREALARCAAAAADGFGRVDLVFCVAGVIHSGSLLASDFADIDKVIAVNLHGVVNTVKAFLPAVIESGGGHLVICSSGFGVVAAPHYSAYNASKFAVRGLAESLRQEMAVDGHPVSVTCVYPGVVDTPIMSSGTFAAGVDAPAAIARFSRMARTSPEAAAAVILRSVQRGKPQAFVGAEAHAAALAVRLLGGSYLRLVPWAARRARRRVRPGRSG
jgi:NADP-dependent 3-hydroxy acid dehydrogenase YdfG